MRTHDTKGYLISVDLDGVLAEGCCWSPQDALTAKPIQKNIDALCELIHAGHHIILYTARKEWWRTETEVWLQKHQVPYHALVMGKLAADFYIDDRNTTLEALLKL